MATSSILCASKSIQEIIFAHMTSIYELFMMLKVALIKRAKYCRFIKRIKLSIDCKIVDLLVRKNRFPFHINHCA